MSQRLPIAAAVLSLSLFALLPIPVVAAPAVEVNPKLPPADLPKVKLERLFKLDRPADFAHDPAGRLFFVEQTGRVLLYENGQLARAPWLDLSDKVYVEYECGLLGLAFHPRFAENGYVYVNYTAVAPGSGPARPRNMRLAGLKTYISEFKVDPAAKSVDRATERVVLTIDQPYTNHNGGQIRFGPDGCLYIGMGDGGAGHDPQNHGQNPRSLLGKMLRIDVTPREGYAVPKDNPFVGRDGWAPEIWALGLRNPWRFCFDRETKLLYAADVGQELWEEIDVIERGGNYGWRIREGMHDLHPVKDPPTMIDPIFEYGHNKHAASVTGGYVYRGSRIPALRGYYLFADYSHGTTWAIKYESGKVTSAGVLIDPQDPARNAGQRPTQPASFGEAPDGELYLLDANGPVYRIVPAE